MNKFLKNKKGYRVVAAALTLSILGGIGLANIMSSSADSKELTAKERLLAKRKEVHASYKMNTAAKDNEEVRAIITLSAKSVADTEDVSDYTSKLKSKEEKIMDNQESLIKKVEKITGNKVINRSAYLVNSFSINATRGQMKKIAKLDGVDTVYEASLYKPCMNTAVKEGNVEAQWNDTDYGYTGEGVVVAVLDTGVNYKHSDMIIDDDVETKFTKEEWKEKIKLLGYGDYFTEKVPFGYDYSTGKDDCLSSSEYHGYHVSGIISGNNQDIQGVARNAQVIGMKVLSDQGGGTTDDIVKGIEDSVKLGADVINMSLGMDSAVVSDEDFMQVALNNAAKEGVICCIAAGNSGTSAGNGDATNIMNMEDTSIVGTPAVTTSSLAVASADNVSFKRDLTIKALVNKTEITFNAYDAVGYGFNIEDAKLIDVGVGVNEDDELTVSEKKLKGNIAIVTSGTSSVSKKVYYLSQAGVKGIIYVNEDEKVTENNINVYDWEKIPVIVVNKTEGAILKGNNKNSFKTIEVVENGEVSGDVTMSSFSSWGPTNELNIKPEISAPGGNIKAAYDGTDRYAILSGTSMATPFVAGSEAIMLNAIKERGLELKGEELTKFMKNSLMNTADAIVNKKTGNYYSVRQQGSGMVDVYGAVDNDVLVTYNGEAKVELGELTGTKDVTLTFTNYGKEDAIYKADTVQIYADYTVNDDNLEDDVDTEEYGIKPVANSVIIFDKSTITVPAGGTATVSARVAISSEYENNKYVEAFIKFEGEDVQDIGLPVLGFYGDFDAEPIMDKSVYEEGESFVSARYEDALSGTGLYGYAYGELEDILGRKVEKVYEEKAETNIEKKFSWKDMFKFINKAKADDFMEEFFTPDENAKKKAKDAKLGENTELVLIEAGDKAYYKIEMDANTACEILVDDSIYPLVNIYDENMNVINSNIAGYMFGMYIPAFVHTKDANVYYIEVSSLMESVGKYDIEFKEVEYDEMYDMSNVAYEEEDAQEAEYIQLKTDKKYTMKNNLFESFGGTFEAKKDGYITLNFETDRYVTYTVSDLSEDAGLLELMEEEYLAEDTDRGTFSKEIKVEAGKTYSIEVSLDYILGSALDEEIEKLGTLKLVESDGSNYYAIKTTYDSDLAAFSPNEDEVLDRVAPGLLILRNAKAVNAYVLDEDKNVIRTIAKNNDVRKTPYTSIMDGMNGGGLANYATAEYANWDGMLYNSQTGEYEVAKDGQYYIQVEAIRAAGVEPQVITMPVKVDTCEPELKDVKMTEKDGESYVTFSVKDDMAMGSYFYLDVETEYDCTTIAKEYVETKMVSEGTYEIKVGELTEDKLITLMIEDMAGNQITEVLYDGSSEEVDEESDEELDEEFDEEFDEEDYDVDMEEGEEVLFDLCEGVRTYDDLLGGNAVSSVFENEISITGMIKAGYEITVNGEEVEMYDDEYCEEEYEEIFGEEDDDFDESILEEDGYDIDADLIDEEISDESGEIFFLKNIEVEAGAKTKDLTLVVTKDGVEIFNKTVTVMLDSDEPTIKVLENEAFDKMTYFDHAKETMVLLKENIKFPFSFQVELIDENVEEDCLEVCESEMDDFEFGEVFGFSNNTIDKELAQNKSNKNKSDEDLSDEEIEDEDASEEYEEDEEVVYEVEYNGNNIYTITVESVEDSLMLELNGRDKACNYGGGTMSIFLASAAKDYEESYALYASHFEVELEDGLVTTDMLNADGTYTIEGSVGKVPQELKINDKKVYVNPKTKRFSYDLKMKNGVNKVYISGKTYNGEDIAGAFELYMDDVKINFTNLPKADKNGDIKVKSEAFNLKGNITSYVNVGLIKVNGNVLYCAPDMVTAPNGGILTKSFDYDIKLKKGVNVINVEVVTMAGSEVSEQVTVQF